MSTDFWLNLNYKITYYFTFYPNYIIIISIIFNYVNYTNIISITSMTIIHIISIMTIIKNYHWLVWLVVLSDDEPCPSHDLPILPGDRSQFDVHGALEEDKVKKIRIHCQYIWCTLYTVNTYDVHDNCYYYINYINYSYYVD